ncbi:hypothetical protein [Rhodococcus opacus]|uniref:hypothetical protein n=1 Tax=Rhodococcus opacus TaxID=37919 RepID=UPI001F53F8E3|nr:hypothetical protein [Rhodococcus opacus]
MFDQEPEHLIAEQQKTLLPVHGLAEPEEAGRRVQAAEESAEGSGDGRVSRRRERGAHLFHDGPHSHGGSHFPSDTTPAKENSGVGEDEGALRRR